MTELQQILCGSFGAILAGFALILDANPGLGSKLIFKVAPFFMGLTLIGIAFNLVK